jgi:hypothetical protein
MLVICTVHAGGQLMRPLAEKTEDVAAFISNCDAKSIRMEALEMLSQNLTVQSYGRCMHNADAGGSKADTLMRYRFSLAFENSEVRTMGRALATVMQWSTCHFHHIMEQPHCFLCAVS